MHKHLFCLEHSYILQSLMYCLLFCLWISLWLLRKHVFQVPKYAIVGVYTAFILHVLVFPAQVKINQNCSRIDRLMYRVALYIAATFSKEYLPCAMQLSRSLTLLELLLFYIFANAHVQELKCIASLEQANTLFFYCAILVNYVL